MSEKPKATPPVVVVCGSCDSTVAADVVGEFSPEVDDPFDSYRVSVTRCPSCGEAIVARQDIGEDQFANLEWGPATRLWPKPEHELSDRIPPNIRATLKQARSTFQVGAYDACAVMCRRAIEELARHFSAGGRSLYDQLEELNNAYVIDENMLEWGHELRLEGNRGAHASDDRVSRDDAKDMLEFTETICNFVFVISQQFRDFKERKENRKGPKHSPPLPPAS
jgi:HEPN domain-containing protein